MLDNKHLDPNDIKLVEESSDLNAESNSTSDEKTFKDSRVKA